MPETKKKELTLMEKIGNVTQAIGKIEKGKENPFYHSQYFDINGLLEALLPNLKAQGLIVTQPIDSFQLEGGGVVNTLKTTVTDGKESIEYEMALPTNIEPQKLGSAITYYRRYSLQSLFCLQASDDDANATKGTTPVKKAEIRDTDF